MDRQPRLLLFGIVIQVALASGCPAPTSVSRTAGPLPEGTEESGLPPDTDLVYTLALENPADPRVAVTILFHGAPAGTSTLRLPDHWGGVRQTGQEIRGFSVRDASGMELPLEHPGGHHWVVKHRPNELLLVSYQLVSPGLELRLDLATERPYHHLILQPGLFHLIGPVGLVFPEHLANAENRAIELRWRKFREAGWTVASSFGLQPEGVRLRATIEDFRHGLFVAGALRLLSRPVEGGTLAVSVTGNDWGFTDTEFVSLAEKIIGAERSFFDDFSTKFFLVSLIPVGPRKEGFLGLSGTGLTQSFALFLSPGAGLKPDTEDASKIKQLLAHELFHNWNGNQIGIDQPEELHYWFSEGFTNHYTRRLLYRAGLITLQEYRDILNQVVVDYMHSRVRNEPNERIRQDFWSRAEVHDLPYLRGDMLAIWIDQEIRQSSKGAKSLDDLMRLALQQSRQRHEAFNNEKLLGLIADLTSLPLAEKVRQVVDRGETVSLPASTYSPCLKLSVVPVGPFDLGFDFAYGRVNHLVHGVKTGSRAYQAGLRDGQKLLGWSVRDGKQRDPVSFTVQDGAKRLTITYLPQGPAVMVPQFSIDPDGSKRCPDLL